MQLIVPPIIAEQLLFESIKFLHPAPIKLDSAEAVFSIPAPIKD